MGLEQAAKRAGDCVLMDSRLLHRNTDNLSN